MPTPRLADRLRSCVIPAGQVGLFSLGQAGFVFKTAEGRTLVVDPYLSDACERMFGFKRMLPAPIAAEDLACDLLILTHEHADHYDLDTVPLLARHPGVVVAGPPECQELWRSQELPEEQFVCFRRGEALELQSFRFRTVHADHGDLSPNCCGLLLDFEGFRVYMTSDTAYRPALIPEAISAKPEVIIPVINGRYGNLDAIEAAQLAHEVGARVAIPSHFWMFVEHGASPLEFLTACSLYAPSVRPYVMAPSEFVLLPEPQREMPASSQS
jgi:L-ascorbate 6-phosphate lactonase